MQTLEHYEAGMRDGTYCTIDQLHESQIESALVDILYYAGDPSIPEAHRYDYIKGRCAAIFELAAERRMARQAEDERLSAIQERQA